MVSVVLLASQESPIASWLRAAGFMVTSDEAEAQVAVFTPDHASDGPQALPRLACLPLALESAGDWPVASGALDYAGVRADAYRGGSSPKEGVLCLYFGCASKKERVGAARQRPTAPLASLRLSCLDVSRGPDAVPRGHRGGGGLRAPQFRQSRAAISPSWARA